MRNAKNPDFPLDKYHMICYPTIRIFKQVQRYRQDFLYGAYRKVFLWFCFIRDDLAGQDHFLLVKRKNEYNKVSLIS